MESAYILQERWPGEFAGMITPIGSIFTSLCGEENDKQEEVT